MAEGYPLQNPRAAWRIYDGEAVIVSADDSSLHMLNAVGTVVWEAADGGSDLDALTARICREFEIEAERARRDVTAFVERLVERGLLTPLERPLPAADREPAPIRAVGPERRPYEPPALRSETIFETTALACQKVGGTTAQCNLKPKQS
jgi:hypothetical protein